MRNKRWTSRDYPDWKLKSFVNFKVRKKLPIPTIGWQKTVHYNNWDYDDYYEPERLNNLQTGSEEVQPKEPENFYIKVRPESIVDDYEGVDENGIKMKRKPFNNHRVAIHDTETSTIEMLMQPRAIKSNTEPEVALNKYEMSDDTDLAEYLQTLSHNVFGLSSKVLVPVLFATVMFLTITNVACLSYCICKKFCRRKPKDIPVSCFSDPAFRPFGDITRADYEDAFCTDDNGICKLYGLTVYDKTCNAKISSKETPVDLSTAIAPLVCAHKSHTTTSLEPVSLDFKAVICSVGNQTDIICPKQECKFVQIPEALPQPFKRPLETWADKVVVVGPNPLEELPPLQRVKLPPEPEQAEKLVKTDLKTPIPDQAHDTRTIDVPLKEEIKPPEAKERVKAKERFKEIAKLAQKQKKVEFVESGTTEPPTVTPPQKVDEIKVWMKHVFVDPAIYGMIPRLLPNESGLAPQLKPDDTINKPGVSIV